MILVTIIDAFLNYTAIKVIIGRILYHGNHIKDMKVRILFFGATADAAGERSVEMEFPAEQPAEDVFRRVIQQYPAVRQHRLLYAVNQEYSTGHEIVKDGDELAIFTPVSGG